MMERGAYEWTSYAALGAAVLGLAVWAYFEWAIRRK